MISLRVEGLTVPKIGRVGGLIVGTGEAGMHNEGGGGISFSWLKLSLCLDCGFSTSFGMTSPTEGWSCPTLILLICCRDQVK